MRVIVGNYALSVPEAGLVYKYHVTCAHKKKKHQNRHYSSNSILFKKSGDTTKHVLYAFRKWIGKET